MTHRADGYNDIFEADVIIRGNCSAKQFFGEGIIPPGTILLWSGTIATIPSGFQLCNGTNGTPDLRDKYIVCAKQDSGGAAKTNITGSLLQTGGTITHTHIIKNKYTSGCTQSLSTGTGYASMSHSYYCAEYGSNSVLTDTYDTGHDHTFNDTHSHAIHNVCTDANDNGSVMPFYALAYIMKM